MALKSLLFDYFFLLLEIITELTVLDVAVSHLKPNAVQRASEPPDRGFLFFETQHCCRSPF